MTLRVIHTSDWHLGKKLHKRSRLEEQESFLNWLISIIKDRKIDALLISGDIFDTPSPPTSALKLYFSFLNKLTSNSSCEIYILSGNHDSGKFLEAPSVFLKKNKITIIGNIHDDISKNFFKISNKDKTISASLLMLPFFRSHNLWNISANKARDINDNTENIFLNAINIIVESFNLYSKKNSSDKSIMMAHHLFGNFNYAGSEQGLSLSGLESIPLDIFHSIDYLALGHIHKYQELKKNKPKAVYSGSPIPFRFNESNQKYIMQLDIKQEQNIEYQKIEIPKFRKLFSIEISPSNLKAGINKIKNLVSEHGESSFFEVKINLTEAESISVDEIKSQLGDIYINLISVKFIRSSYYQNDNEQKIENYSDLTTVELFKKFYQIKFPKLNEVPPEVLNDFNGILDNLANSSHNEDH